jgi:ketosteroid isomerase-like protein
VDVTQTEIQKRNVEIVQTLLKNALSLRFDILGPLIADDFVIYEAEGLPFGGVFRGMEGYIKCMQGIDAFFAGRNLAPPEFVPVGDDRVIMLTAIDGHIKKNGQPVQMPTMSLWQFKGGKVQTVRPFFFDTKKIADLAVL